ncbi:MAG: histidine ammonia-lyase [Elusimicrobia bacterium]|nr:histidine ammonia-lyase [Elusimicrobiota bacterium]
MKPFILGNLVSLGDLVEVAVLGRRAVLGAHARARLKSSRRIVEEAASSHEPVYGINTGFGELSGVSIPKEKLWLLQKNLVLSHAVGVGEPLPEDEARGVLFLRANELARGYSGCRPQVPALMADLLNAGAAPVIPSRGSVGASGDLAPMASMALALIGEGELFFRGRRQASSAVLRRLGLKPLRLEAKEGLSLLNGTQAMQSVGGFALHRAFHVFSAVQIAGAMSLDALAGTPDPLEPALHALKPHFGQGRAAEQLRMLLAKSEIRESHREDDPRTQDPYSLRCMPQVHGAAADVLSNAVMTVTTEMASVTDNPVVAENRILSGGNFHGQPLSFAFDSAAAAMAALANISERRVFQLLAGQAPGLKPFLARDPGVESGWMIAQYTAAALASENKALAHPASCDSIPTSAFREDFVSMGMNAALKLKKIVWNAAQVAGIEMLCAAQGIEARAPLKPGRGVARALELLRRRVPASSRDEVLGPRLELARDLILDGYFMEVLS